MSWVEVKLSKNVMTIGWVSELGWLVWFRNYIELKGILEINTHMFLFEVFHAEFR